MDPISQKTLDIVTDAGKEAVSLVINKTTGDNHPEYEKAVISGTAEAIKELARSDTQTVVRIYESIKIKREQRDFFNLSKVLYKFATLIKIKPKEKIKDDNDFFWNIVEHAKSVSNEEMQDLIAKIIAGEYNNPDTYSMSTLNVLKSIDAKILNDFSLVLGISLSGIGIFKDSFSDIANMTELGVDYTSFLNLQNIGLISSNDSQINFEGELKSVYFNKRISFISKSEIDKKIIIPGFYSLTQAGNEIAQHLIIKENTNFISWLQKKHGNGNLDIKVN
jgi:hypothetical protein